MVEFEWDEAKEVANQRKHGVALKRLPPPLRHRPARPRTSGQGRTVLTPSAETRSTPAPTHSVASISASRPASSTRA